MGTSHMKKKMEAAGCSETPVPIYHITEHQISATVIWMKNQTRYSSFIAVKNVKQSRCSPGVAQRFPGS